MYLTSQKITPLPFLYNGVKHEDAVDKAFDTRAFRSTLDPLLSHAQESAFFDKNRSIPGFIIYGDKSETPTLRIAILGGSTTDPFSDHNWPQELARILAEHRISAHVYNGGVSGYSSNQELLKFVRDVEPLRPDVVITFSGINDLGSLHYTTDHPMVHPYQFKVYEALLRRDEAPPMLLPNTVMAVRKLLRAPEHPIGLTLGPINKIGPVDQWVRNQRMMQSIAKEFDIRMLTILQPAMGTGSYDISPVEQQMLDKAVDGYKWRGNYPELMAQFYDGVRSKLQTIPNAADFTDIFKNKAGMYSDARHQSGAGRTAVAEAVFEELKRRGMIELEP